MSSTPTVTVASICVAPSISTVSKFAVPSISTSPEKSPVAASSSPVIVRFLCPVVSMFASVVTTLEAIAVPTVTPSNVSSSASVRTALPTVIEVAAVNAPAPTIVPDTSRLPLTSIVVALISISVSDTKSRTPSAD